MLVSKILRSIIPTNVRFFVYNLKRKLFKSDRLKQEINKIQIWNKYLNEKYGYIAKKYINTELPLPIKGNFPVWVMWWQGEEEMPEIIRINICSLEKNANGHEINLLTKHNYQNFLHLPDYILNKVENEIISLTHLSDIIRVGLLAERGGLWLDATIFIASPLPIEIAQIYWSPKWTLNENETDTYPLWRGLWTISSISKLTITQCMGIWYSQSQNPVFLCLKDFWFTFWKDEIASPYKWTTEVFLLGCMYENIPSVKYLIENIPQNNPKVFEIRTRINKPYDHEFMEDVNRDTNFFYLTWKENYKEIEQSSGKKTLYQHLKESTLPPSNA